MAKLVHAFGLQDELLALLYTGNDMELAVHSGRGAELEFASGYVIELIGRGLTYDHMAITGGTLDTLVFRDPQGNALATATELRGFDAYFVYNTIMTTSGVALHVSLFAKGDTIMGSGGNDRMDGFDGNDHLKGRAGNDHLVGGPGNDTLLGGAGDDQLDGDTGNDVFTGGAGSDTFFGSGPSDDDIVRDFDTQGADHDWIQSETIFPVTWAKTGRDVLVTFGTGDTMLLLDVKASQFSDAFILF
jgi:Ca2+-binding RTX toxin-like protein